MKIRKYFFTPLYRIRKKKTITEIKKKHPLTKKEKQHRNLIAFSFLPIVGWLGILGLILEQIDKILKKRKQAKVKQ